MKLALIKLSLELLLAIAQIDTPMDAEVVISIVQFTLMEQL